jgi:hypothetical protein
LAALLVLSPALMLGAWVAVHRVPGLGPWVADTLRSIVGVDGVARLEDFAYGLEDRFYTVWRRGEKPRAYWSVPDDAPASVAAAAGNRPRPTASAPGRVVAADGEPLAAAPDRGGAAPDEAPVFRPPNVGPVHESWSAPGDGQWIPLPEDTAPEDTTLFKTLLHPDKKRSWGELFVVAIDLSRVEIHLVAGTREPRANLVEALDVERPGLVPEELHDVVLAAFNGGFKTEHGRYGMHTDGVTLVAPHEGSCSVAYYPDLSLRIGSWKNLGATLGGAQWWRQTPNCMFEGGKMHPRLAEGYVHKWGATLDGRTVIRRSAIGIDAAGKTLFVGISNHTTAPAIANGMRHAGASSVAQLDVNFSYPKFVTFRGSKLSKLRFAVPLAEGFEYSEHEYLRKPSTRDFFYVTPRSVHGRTARK